jgi:2'-5' RNA ligase
MKNIHRTFIAVPLPVDARTALRPFVKKIEEQMPKDAFRFLDSESWHITLSFLGDQDDEGVGRVVSALPSIVPMLMVPEEVCFEKIVYSPSADNPSTIVVMGDVAASAELGEVRDMLEDGLITHEARFRPDNRRFMAHITIARRTKESVLLPELDEAVDIVVRPETIDVLESVVVKGGSQYEVLASEAIGGVL